VNAVAAIAPTARAAARRLYGRLAFDRDRNVWAITGTEPHVALRLKSVFPKLHKHETSRFTFHATPETCAELEWFLARYPMAMSEEDAQALAIGKLTFDTTLQDLERILLPDWRPPAFVGFRDGCAPYEAQLQAVELARRAGRLLLGDDVGLGKTVTALATLCDPDFLPAAVVVQAHLATQWRDFAKYFTNLRVHVIDGTRPYDLPVADLYVFRYSNVAGWIDVAARGIFRSVVFDEIQELRTGFGTAKGRASKAIADHAVRLRMGLSATPIYNYGDEIFPIVEIISPGALGSRDDFIREWCVSRGMKQMVKDPDALGTYLREQHILLRRVRQGRPVNVITQEVPYDEAIAAEADDLARALALKVMRGTFAERGEAARELDILARQVTGVAKARHVAAVVRLLLDDGAAVLLAGWHREVYEIWLRELSAYRPVMYTGSETPSAKDKAKHAFVSGETNLMIISLRSGAGLDGLQARCSTVVIGELDWSPKVHEQLIGRVDRPGQKAEEVTAIYCHADNGSDPLIIATIGLKASQARGITDPLAGVEHVYSDESRIKMLAARYLEGVAP
jgi:hypothetical protein